MAEVGGYIGFECMPPCIPGGMPRECCEERPGGGGPEGPYGLLGPIIIPPGGPPAMELGGCENVRVGVI